MLRAASAANAAHQVACSSLPPNAPPSRSTSTWTTCCGRPRTRATAACTVLGDCVALWISNPSSVGTASAQCVSRAAWSAEPSATVPATTVAQLGQTSSTLPQASVRTGPINSVASAASTTAGSGVQSAVTSPAASRAASGVSATTRANGWPTQCTWPSARTGSGPSVPTSLRPGMSAAVRTASTPGRASAGAASTAWKPACACGAGTGSACRQPSGSGRSAVNRARPWASEVRSGRVMAGASTGRSRRRARPGGRAPGAVAGGCGSRLCRARHRSG